ncbi:mechanosensitive ion channel [Fulvivirga ulvae]|uniref:mechanosensitive ion channel family protein n=1 Tax=Fulvivirga ulvae TaxID=2904245 RepID=UPI001F2185B8|nr:mechanosensitive ion channel domain-containing protein [Fulvivirga ulvae]UII32526.1 mechanosensitive ion channel [Fulvivirga ulvae]
MEYIEQLKLFLATQGTEIGLAIIKGVLVLVIGLQVVRFLSRGFNKFLEKRDTDASLTPFLRSLFHNLLLVLLILSVLATLGIQMTSFVAIIGAAGLAVGLALQGTLQNFAGGVIILTIKPFKVGDYIEGGGHSGTIKEIQIFNTILATPDNVQIVIPNGKLSNDSIKNYSANDNRRVDLVFGIGYGDDIKKAKEILENMVKNDERVLSEPEPTVTVASLGDSSVNFNVRPWVNRADYWSLYWDFQERVKLEFDKNGISIPFPQRDVHIYNEK